MSREFFYGTFSSEYFPKIRIILARVIMTRVAVPYFSSFVAAPRNLGWISVSASGSQRP